MIVTSCSISTAIELLGNNIVMKCKRMRRYSLIVYVRESSGEAMENEVRQFVLRYACCPDKFLPRMRQMLFNLAHSFEWD